MRELSSRQIKVWIKIHITKKAPLKKVAASSIQPRQRLSSLLLSLYQTKRSTEESILAFDKGLHLYWVKVTTHIKSEFDATYLQLACVQPVEFEQVFGGGCHNSAKCKDERQRNAVQ